MRSNVDSAKVQQLMTALGRAAKGPGTVYFTGGASAVLVGWRGATVDIDVRFDPEAPGIFEAIAKIKQDLNINIELASPQDFLPLLPGWQNRSVFIGREGKLSFYHYDFTAQALSKLSRGYERDTSDVQAMYAQGLFSLETLRECFEAIEPELIKFPALEADVLRNRMESFASQVGDQSEEENDGAE